MEHVDECGLMCEEDCCKRCRLIQCHNPTLVLKLMITGFTKMGTATKLRSSATITDNLCTGILPSREARHKKPLPYRHIEVID